MIQVANCDYGGTKVLNRSRQVFKLQLVFYVVYFRKVYKSPSGARIAPNRSPLCLTAEVDLRRFCHYLTMSRRVGGMQPA